MKALAAKAPASSGVNGPSPPSCCSALRARPMISSNHPMMPARTTLATAGIVPAGGDQLLQHAHIARRDVVIEIVARPVPLLRELERRVAEQGVLAIEQLRVEILEQRQHHPLLGAEVIVDLAQRHAGRRRHVAGRQARNSRSGAAPSWPLRAASVLVSGFFANARAIAISSHLATRWTIARTALRRLHARAAPSPAVRDALRRGSGISIETCSR